jgi:hypothetical protein
MALPFAAAASQAVGQPHKVGKRQDPSEATMAEQAPLPLLTAWPSVGRCVLASVRLLAAGYVSRVRMSGSGCASPTARPHACTGRPSSTGERRRSQPFSS